MSSYHLGVEERKRLPKSVCCLLDDGTLPVVMSVQPWIPVRSCSSLLVSTTSEVPNFLLTLFVLLSKKC